MNVPREPEARLLRNALPNCVLVLALAVLICPAVTYFTSPWWAEHAIRHVANRYWMTDVDFAEATIHPFTGTIDCSGGTFRGPRGHAFHIEGSVSRFRLEYNLASLLFNHRIHRITLDLSSVTVISSGKDGVSRSSKLFHTTPEISVSHAGCSPTREKTRAWCVNRLILRIGRVILHSSKDSRQRATSMDLNFKSSYEDICDVGQLADLIVKDLFSGMDTDFLPGIQAK